MWPTGGSVVSLAAILVSELFLASAIYRDNVLILVPSPGLLDWLYNTSHSASSLGECAVHCVESSSCVALGHNSSQRRCVTYSRTAGGDPDTLEVEGLAVYGVKGKDLSRFPAGTYANCSEALLKTNKAYGAFTLALPRSNMANVFCEQYGYSAYTIIQRRLYGSVNFTRSWDEYAEGFGNATGEFWVGNENLHLLTRSDDQSLVVVMEDREGMLSLATYETFIVGDSGSGYALTVRGFDSISFSDETIVFLAAGDSLSGHNGMKFSTYDRDNDRSEQTHCGKVYGGGWWFTDCLDSNLNGLYDGGQHGIIWKTWRDYYESIARVWMLLIPRKDFQ